MTAHFGRGFRPPRAHKDHWQVVERLLQDQSIKRHKRRKLTYTITWMLWGTRPALNDLLEQQGFRQLIQTAFIERLDLTFRQGIAGVGRQTWALASEQHLLLHTDGFACITTWFAHTRRCENHLQGERGDIVPLDADLELSYTSRGCTRSVATASTWLEASQSMSITAPRPITFVCGAEDDWVAL